MPGSFFDTSALAKHYHVEIGSAEIDRQWGDFGRELYVSRIGIVEAISVFAGNRASATVSEALQCRARRPVIRCMTAMAAEANSFIIVAPWIRPPIRDNVRTNTFLGAR